MKVKLQGTKGQLVFPIRQGKPNRLYVVESSPYHSKGDLVARCAETYFCLNSETWGSGHCLDQVKVRDLQPGESVLIEAD